MLAFAPAAHGEVRQPNNHGAGNDWRFTRGHAPCLLTLVTAPEAGVARGLRRAPCGGG